MKKFWIFIIVLAAAYFAYTYFKPEPVREKTSQNKLSSFHIPKIDLEQNRVAAPQQDTAAQNKNKKPNEIFASNRTGRGIAKIVDLYDYMDNPTSDKGKEVLDEIQKLRETPKETFEEIRKGIFLLPDSYEIKRQFLLQYAVTLDVDKEEKMAFLKEGMEKSLQNIQESANVQSTYTPSIIFDTFISVSEDASEIEKFISEAMPKSTTEVQKVIIASYNRVNSDKAMELAKRYSLNTF